MVGCGKLGLMVALSIESKGHQVKGYDISPRPAQYLEARAIPFKEEHAEKLLAETRMEMVSLGELAEWAEILFLAPQTPHDAQYEGATPLPESRKDFDYSHLVECVRQVNLALVRPTVCVVISTVLPGTIERDILPMIDSCFDLVYSPQFIAMGTTYKDFIDPEFWLIGSDGQAASTMLDFYQTICPAPVLETDIRTAEGIKVLYNTFITTKTVLANLYGELSHRCGMRVDDIYRAISLSTRRLLSPRYLEAGMGDGGGCHPRDNIALSWLARARGLSCDFFEALMTARERHADFLAELIDWYHWENQHLPVILLGRAFKPETRIETGSPARLVSSLLTRRGVPHLHQEDAKIEEPYLVFIACRHERYRDYKFPAGSIVVDPFRYIPDQAGVEVIRIGEPQDIDLRAKAKRATA